MLFRLQFKSTVVVEYFEKKKQQFLPHETTDQQNETNKQPQQDKKEGFLFVCLLSVSLKRNAAACVLCEDQRLATTNRTTIT